MMPGHEWDYQWGLISRNGNYAGNQEKDPHLTVNIGGSAYFLIGGDITLSFDLDEFLDRMGR